MQNHAKCWALKKCLDYHMGHKKAPDFSRGECQPWPIKITAAIPSAIPTITFIVYASLNMSALAAAVDTIVREVKMLVNLPRPVVERGTPIRRREMKNNVSAPKIRGVKRYRAANTFPPRPYPPRKKSATPVIKTHP